MRFVCVRSNNSRVSVSTSTIPRESAKTQAVATNRRLRWLRGNETPAVLVGGEFQKKLEDALAGFLAEIEEVASDALPEGGVSSEREGIGERGGGTLGEGGEGMEVVLERRREARSTSWESRMRSERASEAREGAEYTEGFSLRSLR